MIRGDRLHLWNVVHVDHARQGPTLTDVVATGGGARRSDVAIDGREVVRRVAVDAGQAGMVRSHKGAAVSALRAVVDAVDDGVRVSALVVRIVAGRAQLVGGDPHRARR